LQVFVQPSRRAADAQTNGGTLREACRADYQKFCANVQCGGGRIRQ
jgi:hypothetical protein